MTPLHNIGANAAARRGGTAVFTIVAKNYLPQARVLMRSAKEHHPDWRRFVILADRIDGFFDPSREDFEIFTSTELQIPESRWFHFKYSILELCTAVKPYAFEHLFEVHGFDRVVYLDPDVRIFSPMRMVSDALESANIVLTPHLTSALDDDKRPGEIDILRSGTYNLGFIAIRNSPGSIDFLAWWQQKLYDHCVVDLARGLFVDQRWVDLAPGLFPGVTILRDPGYNVAYWNLSRRTVTCVDGGYQVGQSPLSFFHFSGYDAEQPRVLSRHQNRHRLEDLPEATRQIHSAYRDDLYRAGYSTCRKWPYAFAFFDNGAAIPDMCRPVQHEAPEAVRLVQDPFTDEGYNLFLEVWNSPVQEGGGRPGISRLAYRIYRTRSDVQSAMPDIFGGNYRRFLEWMLSTGRKEHGLGEVFLTTIADAVRTVKDHKSNLAAPDHSIENTLTDDLAGDAEGIAPGSRLRLTRLAAAIYRGRPELQGYFPDPCGRDRARFLVWLLTYGKAEHHLAADHLAPLREQWQSVVGSLPSVFSRLRYRVILRTMAASVYGRSLIRDLPFAIARLRRAGRRSPGSRALRGPDQRAGLGVNLVGYFRSETGVGQSARAAYGALQAASVPASLRLAADAGPSRKQDSTIGPMSAELPYATNLFHVNADQTFNIVRSVGGEFFRNRRNIGYWAWELEEFPDRWLDAFQVYQEIWTPSAFCCQSLRRKTSLPVFTVPHAISPVVFKAMDRQHFGLSPDRFVFLCAFDVLSVMERKNPLAAVRAFESAFGSDPRYQLVLKVNNAEGAPKSLAKQLDALRNACSSSSIQMFDETISREETYGLTRCVDCVVSLHRSEGFGFLIAEAMYFGKPVIVTNYSGNTDFTRSGNSMLVDYRLVPVGPGCEPYEQGNLWADPDVAQAASHMRCIAANTELRGRISVAGSDFVKETLSPQAVGLVMRSRLEAHSSDARKPAVSAAAARL